MALVTLGLVWYFWTDGTLGYDARTDYGTYGHGGITDSGYYDYGSYAYEVAVVRRLKKTVEIVGYELTVGEFVAILVAIVAAIAGIAVQVILGRRAWADPSRRSAGRPRLRPR